MLLARSTLHDAGAPSVKFILCYVGFHCRNTFPKWVFRILILRRNNATERAWHKKSPTIGPVVSLQHSTCKLTISLFEGKFRVSTKADVSRHLLTSVLLGRLHGPLATVTIASTQVDGMGLRKPAESGLVNSSFVSSGARFYATTDKGNRQESLHQLQSMYVNLRVLSRLLVSHSIRSALTNDD